jgi:hypothetical protein
VVDAKDFAQHAAGCFRAENMSKLPPRIESFIRKLSKSVAFGAMANAVNDDAETKEGGMFDQYFLEPRQRQRSYAGNTSHTACLRPTSKSRWRLRSSMSQLSAMTAMSPRST